MHREHPVRRAFLHAMQSPPIAEKAASAAALFVGYSGGADSAALLVLISEFAAVRGIPCEAIHVHHGIRGAEADLDEAVCRDFCAERGIFLHICRVDAPTYAKEHRIGLEDAARRLRYGAFEARLAAHPGALCATAHSADDQLETVLFHLLRGSGLDGLCGIPPVREDYIRPLLGVSAADIRAFCAEENISYVQDSTNGDTAYTRNYIRAEIVPRLRQITPVPEAAAVRMSELLRVDADYLRQEARRALRDYADAGLAPAEYLKALPDALLSRAIVQLYENASGGCSDLSAVQIRAVMELVRRGGAGQISLPGGRSARLEHGTLDFRAAPEYPTPPADFSARLRMGENLFPEFGFGIRMDEGNAPDAKIDINIYNLFIWDSFPSATIQGEVFLRFRRAGDTVRMGGMTRKMRKLMNEKNIAAQSRDRWPVICDGAGILWVPGVCSRDQAADGGKNTVFSYFTI